MGMSFFTELDGFEIGAGDFLYSFFSTVARLLEKDDWGSRFPKIMLKLYLGCLPYEDIREGMREMETIREELKAFDASQLVWDFDNPQKRVPPWAEIDDADKIPLSEYFTTSDGEDFFDQALRAMRQALEERCPLEME